MTLADVKARLDQIAWQEQIEHETSDRPGRSSAPDLGRIQALICDLAGSIDVALLEALKHEDGYLVWALRLAPSVEGVDVKVFATPYVASPNWRVQHWARLLFDRSRND